MSNGPKQKVATLSGSQDEITEQIVKNMQRLIKRDVSDSLIKKKAAELKGGNKDQTIRNIYDYVWQNFPYKNDPPGREHLTAPKWTIRGKAPYMDCDELVMVLCSLLEAAGIKTLIKTISWRNENYTHVVCEAQLEPDAWIVLDPTRKSNGYGGQEKKIIRERRYKNG